MAASEDVIKFGIEVEKKLCELLDREWTPTGISIVTLLSEIKSKINQSNPMKEPTILKINDDTDLITDFFRPTKKLNGKKVVVAFSAGTDSTTAAYMYRAMGYEVTLAVFDDGPCNDIESPWYDPSKPVDKTNFSAEFYHYVRIHQEHTKDWNQFKYVELRFPQLPALEATKSSKPGRDNAAAAEADGLGFWVGFKGLMAQILLSYGAAHGYEEVVFGHMPYNSHYEDELPANFERLRQYMVHAYGSRVAIPAISHPFYNPMLNTKEQVIQYAINIGVPLEDTYSCRRGEGDWQGEALPLHHVNETRPSFAYGTYRWRHCGTCENCVERKRAFAALGIEDPAPYMEA